MKKANSNLKIILPGGPGLVGQNLVARLKFKGYSNILVIDKYHKSLEVLKKVQPDVVAIFADLSKSGPWQDEFEVNDWPSIFGVPYTPFSKGNQ